MSLRSIRTHAMLAGFLARLTLGCGVFPPADAPTTARAECAAACAQFEALGCEEGRPSLDGVPCVDVCERVRVELGPDAMPTACVARATSCDAARACSY